jgi:hypothetical protein
VREKEKGRTCTKITSRRSYCVCLGASLSQPENKRISENVCDVTSEGRVLLLSWESDGRNILRLLANYVLLGLRFRITWLYNPEGTRA